MEMVITGQLLLWQLRASMCERRWPSHLDLAGWNCHEKALSVLAEAIETK